MRNRQEWFNEKMAAVSPEIVTYCFASNALLTIRVGYNHLVINDISVFIADSARSSAAFRVHK